MFLHDYNFPVCLFKICSSLFNRTSVFAFGCFLEAFKWSSRSHASLLWVNWSNKKGKHLDFFLLHFLSSLSLFFHWIFFHARLSLFLPDASLSFFLRMWFYVRALKCLRERECVCVCAAVRGLPEGFQHRPKQTNWEWEPPAPPALMHLYSFFSHLSFFI